MEPKGVKETDFHTTGFAGSLCPAHNVLSEISIIKYAVACATVSEERDVPEQIWASVEKKLN